MSAKSEDQSVRSPLIAAGVGFATALVLVVGIQAKTGGSGGQPELLAAPTTTETVAQAESSPPSSRRDQGPILTTLPPAAGTEVDQAEGPNEAPELVAEPVSVVVPEAPVGPRCQPLSEELWRREEAGEIEYEEYVELTDDEYNNSPLNLPVPRTDMAAIGERPEFADFGDSYEIADVPDDRLDWVVGRCWELGFLD